jgi:hypothetical protein
MKKFLSAKIRLALVITAGTAISLSATVTHAGFQWVPPAGQDASNKGSGAVSPATPAPTDPVDQMVLPMPGDQIQAQPQLNPGDAALNAAPSMPSAQPQPDYRAPLAAPPAQTEQHVLKVKTIAPPAPAPTEPMPLMAPAVPEPVAQQPIMPPPSPEPAIEAATTTKVIMPPDAPQTAIDSEPNSQRLVINPYPTVDGGQPYAAPSSSAAPASQAAISVPQGDFDVIEGFGADMPLALALQQIVPQGYAYSFGQGVNPGALVTWDGGKPWNQVIASMLAPLNLEFAIEGTRVHIRQAGSFQQGAASSPVGGDLVRRANIKDPGEQSQAQSADSLSGIESAAGNPTSIIAEPSSSGNAADSGNIAPAATQNTAENKIWDAKAGESLKDTLARWSEKAGVEMIWMASYDYTIKQDVTVEDDFDKAVKSIVSSNADVKNAPDIQLVQNSDGATGSLLVKDRG